MCSVQPFSREAFLEAYCAELARVVQTAKPGSDYDWPDKSDAEVRRVAEKLTGIYAAGCGGVQSLSSSPPMRKAAARFGISRTDALMAALSA